MAKKKVAKKKAAKKSAGRASAKPAVVDIDEAVREVMELADQLGEPKNMSKSEYRDLLNGIRGECDVRIEAVNEELTEEDDEREDEDDEEEQEDD